MGINLVVADQPVLLARPRYHGKFSFDCFSHQKSVLFKMNFGDVWARYPPYDSTKIFFLGLVQTARPQWQFDVLKLVALVLLLLFVRWLVWPAALLHYAVRLVLE